MPNRLPEKRGDGVPRTFLTSMGTDSSTCAASGARKRRLYRGGQPHTKPPPLFLAPTTKGFTSEGLAKVGQLRLGKQASKAKNLGLNFDLSLTTCRTLGKLFNLKFVFLVRKDLLRVLTCSIVIGHKAQEGG